MIPQELSVASLDSHAAEIVSIITSFNMDEAKRRHDDMRSHMDDRIRVLRLTSNEQAFAHPSVNLALGKTLLERYSLFGDLPLLNESISIIRALLAHPTVLDSHPIYEDALDTLGEALCARFEHTTVLGDALEAISVHQQSLDLRKDNGLDVYPALHGLGVAIYVRNYGDTPQPSFPLEQFQLAAKLLTEALGELSSVDPRRPRTLSYLQRAYRDVGRPNNTFLLSYRAARDALMLTPTDHPHHLLAVLAGARALSIPWGTAKGTLVEYEGVSYDDVVQAVGYVSDLMAHINHPHYGSSLSRLVTWLSNAPNAANFDKILSQARLAYQVCPKRSIPILNVSVALIGALGDAYSTTGRAEYVDEQIDVARTAVKAQYRPGRRPFRPLLYNLAQALYNRYKSGGRLEDLEEAVSLMMDCVALVVDAPIPGELLYMQYAGTMLIARYHHTGDITDVDTALDLGKRCIPVVPEDNPEMYISVIALALELRFRHYGSTDDLREAIGLLRSLLHRLPLYSPVFKSDLFDSFARCLCLLAYTLREPQHAHEALDFRQQGLQLVSSNRLRASEYSRGCAQEHACLWTLLGDRHHLTEAVRHFSEGAYNAEIPIHSRFACAVEWSKACKDADPEIRSEALRCAVTLLPQVILFGNLSERLAALKQAPGIAREAAIHELSRSRVDVAVELLEQGRAVFWNRALNSRQCEDNLPSGIGRRLAEIMRSIDLEASDDGQVLTRRKTLHEELDELLHEARLTPGYEHLLRTRSLQELSTVAHGGPVVVLLANETRAVALIIRDMEVPCQIVLPGVDSAVLEGLSIDVHENLDNERRKRFPHGSKKRYQKMPPTTCKVRHGDTGQLSWKDILERLWDLVVDPIFSKMGLKRGALEQRPRLWWCPTGPFAFLPLHAAGRHRRRRDVWTSDYVISSYTPSLSALLQAQRNPPLDVLQRDGAAALLVAEPQPIGEEWDAIPNTLAEVSGVKELLPSAEILGSLEGGATIHELIEKMQSASVVHLACHGTQDGRDPLQSGFALRDGLLTLSRIMELDVPNAAVAFLSACESAMGDGRLPDESVHLAAAMLFLGFRSVVGTMWAMDDESGPQVAHKVYEAMLAGSSQGIFDYGCIPRALDSVMREFRADKEIPISVWALWIHLGI